MGGRIGQVESRQELPPRQRCPSRSDGMRVAVGFNPRDRTAKARVAERRLKTMAIRSSVAPRRPPHAARPWAKAHGYRQAVAPRRIAHTRPAAPRPLNPAGPGEREWPTDSSAGDYHQFTAQRASCAGRFASSADRWPEIALHQRGWAKEKGRSCLRPCWVRIERQAWACRSASRARDRCRRSSSPCCGRSIPWSAP